MVVYGKKKKKKKIKIKIMSSNEMKDYLKK